MVSNSNSIPLAFLIIFTVLCQTSLSDQYEEASLTTNIRSEQQQQHVVKTFQNEYGGDIYDCVDIYKQPSLYHPLLKNHKIQMKPNSKPKRISLEVGSSSKSKKTATKSTTNNKHFKIIGEGLKNGCPRGTVPIRRSTSSTQRKEEEGFTLSRTKSPNNQHNSSDFIRKSSSIEYFAGMQTKDIPNKHYYGVSSRIALYKPTVEDDQMSGTVISFQSGGDRAFLNSVEAGWMVNPELYGDSNTRLYTRWTADDGYTTGCYNTQCPGFIVVSSQLPVDLIFNETTTDEEQQVQIILQIFQDETSRFWWLRYGNVYIGYWPKEIVPNLVDGAHTVRVGGIIGAPSVQSKPPMGSGFAFVKHWSYYNSAFFAQVQLVDDAKQAFNPDNSNLDKIMNQCYLVADNSYKDYSMENFDFIFGYSFVFGGQGGDESACQLG